MSQHPNAKLTPKGRETLVSRIGSGLGVAPAAPQLGVSRQTASKWLARARRGEGLADRSSRPRRLARLTPPRGRGARLRGPQGHAAGAARPGGRDGRAGPHVRPDRRQAQPAPPGRHRPRHGRGAAARPRDGRALRARAPRGARPRRRQEGGAHTRRRRPQGPRAGPGSRACTWRSTTTAASPTPSCRPTRGRARPAASCPGRSRSTRGWASPWSGS